MPPSSRALVMMAAIAAASLSVSACHEEGDVRVTALAFDGNKTFSDGELKAVVATRTSGRLPWSRQRYFTRNVFDADLQRLKNFYADHGYPSMQVTSVDVAFNTARDAVSLRVVIDEGEPLVVERIVFTGLDGLPKELTDRLGALSLEAGTPRDRHVVAASREQLTFFLRDRGYAQATVATRESAGSTPRQTVVTFEVTPGPASTFGPVSVQGLQSVHESLVVRTLSFKPGDLYRESRVIESQRRLANLGIFDFAHVGADSKAETPPPPGVVPMRATLTEGRPQRYQIGVGYGTEDGPRGSFTWDHLNFLGDARRLSWDSRYSLRLRGTGLEFLEPYFLSNRLSFTARLGAWWTEESTYASQSLGGRFGIAFHTASHAPDVAPVDNVLRATYVNESLGYNITPEALADQTQFDELIALGLDPTTGHGEGRLAALDFDVERTATDRRSDPRGGYTAALHLRYATPSLGGTFRYSEALTEARVFVPLAPRIVWATRGRAGAIFSESADDLPFSQRYFLGGSSSLRGWGRFEVAPLTTDGLPIGGRALVEISTELRIAVTRSLGAVLFVDAGNVWDESTTVRLRDLRVDIGPGLRWTSPIGIVRADVGYQLTPIDGLVVNGEPSLRTWRVHFSIGHAF